MNTERKTVLYLLAILVFLSVADWATTVAVLEAGGEELSPLMRSLFGVTAWFPLVFKGVVLGAASAVILWAARTRPADAIHGTAFVALVYSIIVAWNAAQLI